MLVPRRVALADHVINFVGSLFDLFILLGRYMVQHGSTWKICTTQFWQPTCCQTHVFFDIFVRLVGIFIMIEFKLIPKQPPEIRGSMKLIIKGQ